MNAANRAFAGRALALGIMLGVAVQAGASPVAVDIPPAAGGPFAAALPWDHLASAHPGEWAEYVTRVGGYPVGPYLRFLVVGPADGGEGLWLEVWISSRPGSATQAWRLLLVDDPAVPGGVARIVGRVLGGESREHPVPPPAPGPAAAAAAARWEAGQEEAVQTEVGTVRATRSELRSGGELVGETWIASSIPVFGLVRLELASGAGLELVGSGRAGRGVVDVPADRPHR